MKALVINVIFFFSSASLMAGDAKIVDPLAVFPECPLCIRTIIMVLNLVQLNNS